MMREGDDWPNKHDLSSLRILGSVGEPINPEAWMWYYNVIGKGKCPIVDTWWQTETGGILITPLPGATPLKPGSATFPSPAFLPKSSEKMAPPPRLMRAVIWYMKRPWPGLMRGVYGSPDKIQEDLFHPIPRRIYHR